MIDLLIAVAVVVASILGALFFRSASKVRKSEYFDEDNKHIKG